MEQNGSIGIYVQWERFSTKQTDKYLRNEEQFTDDKATNKTRIESYNRNWSLLLGDIGPSQRLQVGRIERSALVSEYF